MFTFLLAVAACDKKTPYQAPHIEIILPTQFEKFTTPGLMPIKIEVSSERPIKYISAGIDNEKQVSLFGKKYFYPDRNHVVIEYNLSLGVLSGNENGPFYLNIGVDDGIELNHAFLQVDLTTTPLQSKGIYVINRPSVNVTRLIYFDESGSAFDSLQFAGEYIDMTVSQENDMFFLATSVPAKLYAFQHTDFDQRWMLEPENPYPEYTTLTHDYSHVFVGMANERISTLADLTGFQLVSTPILVDTVPQKIGVNNDYIIGDFINRKPGEGAWVSFYRVTGAPFNRFTSNIRVIDFYKTDDENLFMAFGNIENESKYVLFDVVRNKILTELKIGVGFSNSKQVDKNKFLLSSGKGVYLFNTSNQNILHLFDIQEVVVDMKYDDVLNRILLATENEIGFYEYPGGGLLSTIQSASPIKAIHLRQAY